jgi:2-iminobutanoate/2-iminopropanoate deaminase
MKVTTELPYPPYCIAGNTIYFSGVGALKKDGTLVEGGFKEHVGQAFANIDALMEEAGVTKAHIVRIAVKLAHISYLPLFEEAYREFLEGYDDHPARTFDAGSQFPFGSLVEIEVTATFDAVRRAKFVQTFSHDNSFDLP